MIAIHFFKVIEVPTQRKFKSLTEFVFHGHDDFYVVQGIQTEIVDEVRLHGHLQLKSGSHDSNFVLLYKQASMFF